MDTYSPVPMDRSTPLRISVSASPVPSERWTFWARSSARDDSGAAWRDASVAAEWNSVRATDYLDGVILRGAARRVNRCDKDNHHRAHKCDDVLTQVLAHQ